MPSYWKNDIILVRYPLPIFIVGRAVACSTAPTEPDVILS
jgi:hypothetical protein